MAALRSQPACDPPPFCSTRRGRWCARRRQTGRQDSSRRADQRGVVRSRSGHGRPRLHSWFSRAQAADPSIHPRPTDRARRLSSLQQHLRQQQPSELAQPRLPTVLSSSLSQPRHQLAAGPCSRPRLPSLPRLPTASTLPFLPHVPGRHPGAHRRRPPRGRGPQGEDPCQA